MTKCDSYAIRVQVKATAKLNDDQDEQDPFVWLDAKEAVLQNQVHAAHSYAIRMYFKVVANEKGDQDEQDQFVWLENSFWKIAFG